MVTKLVSSGTPGAIFLAVAAAFLIAAVAGAVSGFVVARLNVAPIVATLGMNALLIGATWAVSEGAARRTPTGLSDVIGSTLLGVPVTVVVAIVLTVVVGSSFDSRRPDASSRPSVPIRGSPSRQVLHRCATHWARTPLRQCCTPSPACC
ncbi:Ribose ABC transport system, permease protein RbsC [Rhodococcus sp. B7740]|nr:hypothetical protein [Rhodococcus sp. B7740]AJW43246.1 Ribose ABC transport system, permease protein RbsC [Rhodococcus sp. B7740]